MTAPEEAKSEVEAAFEEWIKATYHGDYGITALESLTARKAFAAGAKFVAGLNQEKIKQLIKEVD